jgi:hypothetical protein
MVRVEGSSGREDRALRASAGRARATQAKGSKGAGEFAEAAWATASLASPRTLRKEGEVAESEGEGLSSGNLMKQRSETWVVLEQWMQGGRRLGLRCLERLEGLAGEGIDVGPQVTDCNRVVSAAESKAAIVDL